MYIVEVLIHNSMQSIRGVANGGPDRATTHPNVGYAWPTKIERLRYSYRTVIYSIKAVMGPDCALPT